MQGNGAWMDHMLGGFMKIPYQAYFAEGAEDIVADIHFPPEEALVDRALVVVVVVMPSFPQGDDG